MNGCQGEVLFVRKFEIEGFVIGYDIENTIAIFFVYN